MKCSGAGGLDDAGVPVPSDYQGARSQSKGASKGWSPTAGELFPPRQLAADRRTGFSDAVGLMRRAGSDEQDARDGIEQPGSSHECRGCSLYASAQDLTNEH